VSPAFTSPTIMSIVKPWRQHDRLRATVAAGGEQLEGAAAVGLWVAAEGSRHLAGGLLGPGGKTTRFPHQVAYS
jgi:hypothetical protein